MAIENLPPPIRMGDREYRAGDVLYEVAFQKWKQQQADIEGLDRKGFSLFTISSGAIIAGLTVIRLTSLQPPSLAQYLSSGALCVFGLTIALTILAVWPITFSMGPTPDEMEDNACLYDSPTFQVWAGVGWLDGFKTNQPLLKRKSTWLRWSLIVTALEVGLIGAALIATILA